MVSATPPTFFVFFKPAGSDVSLQHFVFLSFWFQQIKHSLHLFGRMTCGYMTDRRGDTCQNGSESRIVLTKKVHGIVLVLGHFSPVFVS